MAILSSIRMSAPALESSLKAKADGKDLMTQGLGHNWHRIRNTFTCKDKIRYDRRV